MPAPIQVDADKQSANATAASLTITKPTNLADNDVLYAEISRDNSNASDAITVPSGWTALGSSEIDNGTYTCGIYRKVISNAAGEPADYTWSWTSSEKVCGWIIRVTGVDNTTPEDVTPSNNTGDSNAPRCLSVTTVTTNTLILAVGGMNSKGFLEFGEEANWTAPAGMSEFFDIASTGGGGASAHAQASAAEVNQSAIGATGDKDFATVDTAEWVAFLIAVRPSDPSDPPEPPAGLPTTIVNAPGISGYSRSIKSSADNFYVVARTTNTTLDVYKTTDPEASSWAAQDTANNPATSGNTYTVLSVTRKGDILYVASFEGTRLYQYHEFNMATDTWSVTDETIENTSSQNPPALPWISIAVRSNVDVIVAYAGSADKVGGVKKDRVDYARREGGTWTVGIALDAGGSFNYDNPNVIKGPLTDDMHILFLKNTASLDSWQARTLDAANNLSSLDADPLDHNQATLGTTNAVAYDDAGTQRMLFAAIRGTLDSDRVYAPATEDGSDDIALGTTLTDSSGEDARLGGPAGTTGLHSLAELDGEIHHLFSGGGTAGVDQDLYYTTSTDDGATWSTPTVELSGVTINFISATIYVRGIDTVLAYVYEDDGKQLYNEKVLIAGQTHQMMM